MGLTTIKPWFDAITALSGLLVAVVSLRLLHQLSLLREQNNLSRKELEETNSWNKRNATFSFISPEQHTAQAEAIRNILRKHEIDPRSYKPLDDAETNKLIDDEGTYHALINALNFYEHYAVAVNSGLFDDEAAYGLDSAPVIRVFRRFERFINHVRERVGSKRSTSTLKSLLCAGRLARRPKRVKIARSSPSFVVPCASS
jgi:Domain of unknown function (DUF4760)